MFKQRIGPDPHIFGRTPQIEKCPDIWELENGDFAIIGGLATGSLIGALPETAGCGPDEAIVVIPRALLVRAKSSIPSS